MAVSGPDPAGRHDIWPARGRNIFKPIYTNQKISQRKFNFLASLEKLKVLALLAHIPTDNDLIVLSNGCLSGWGAPVPIQPRPQLSLSSH